MARTKEFDVDVALDAAMRLFWRHGYEATSLTDLLGAMGVGRASFYDTFGSKHELYLRAMERYMTGAAGLTPVEILARPGPAIEAVRALVDHFANPGPDGDPRGCLVTNACVDCPEEDAAVRRRLSTYRAGQESALATTLRRARAEGDLPAGSDPVALAQFLTVLFNGMSVLARSDDGCRTRLHAAAGVALAALAVPVPA